MALPSHTPISTELTEFDEMLVAKSIATREQCLRCKGFSDEQVAEILESEAEQLAASVNAEAEAAQKPAGEDDSFEDSDPDDDHALQAYRAARLAEMKSAQSRPAPGLVHVTKATWQEEVVDASAGRWVVVHLHAESSLEPQTGRGVPSQCAAISASLRQLGESHAALKCCQIEALEAIPPSQLCKLPTIFCYRDGSLQQSLMGPEAFGEAPSAAQLADALEALGVLSAPRLSAPAAPSDHDSDDLSD